MFGQDWYGNHQVRRLLTFFIFFTSSLSLIYKVQISLLTQCNFHKGSKKATQSRKIISSVTEKTIKTWENYLILHKKYVCHIFYFYWQVVIVQISCDGAAHVSMYLFLLFRLANFTTRPDVTFSFPLNSN